MDCSGKQYLSLPGRDRSQSGSVMGRSTRGLRVTQLELKTEHQIPVQLKL